MNVIRKSELSVYIGIRFIRDFVEGTLLEKAGSIKYVTVLHRNSFNT